MKIQTNNEWDAENSSRHENVNGIKKENPHGGKTGNEKFRRSSSGRVLTYKPNFMFNLNCQKPHIHKTLYVYTI